MPLVLLLGGARSGKSRLAVSLASQQPQPVVFVATATAGDSNMASRIDRHRAERPAAWATVEEPLALTAALASVAAEDCVIVDCLTLWVANLLEQGLGDEDIERRSAEAGSAARVRPGLTIVVSNEVGLGIVPASELGRSYRDLLGRVNTGWADAAEQAYLLVAGRALTLERFRGDA